jgi:acyl-CoA thioesterase-1
MLRFPRWIVLVAVASVPAACTQPEPSVAGAVGQTARVATPAPRVAEPTRATASEVASSIPKIVVLGDSLTAGYGLDKAQSYPALLQKHLDEAGYRYEVVNAGVSGDTSAGGLRRLDWSLEGGNVRVLILELGANDGLRGLPVEEMKKNLGEIIARTKSRGIAVILAGMEAPPNWGPAYITAFHQAFRHLSTEHKVPLIPFLLDGVAGDRALNIADGIHPNPEGARIVERNVWRTLRPLLEPPRTP